MKITQTNKAYNNIRQAILNKDLIPGYPLTEVELSERLQMSRTPIREALTRLEAEGMIHVPNGKGYVVKVHSLDEIRQAYEFGGCLEAMAAYLIASSTENIENDIVLMEKCVEIMENYVDVSEWVDADDKFHEILRNSCGNEFIKTSLIRVYGIVHSTRVLITKILLDKSKSTMEHRLTLEKIKQKDASAAQSLMSTHWKRITNEVMIILE